MYILCVRGALFIRYEVFNLVGSTRHIIYCGTGPECMLVGGSKPYSLQAQL